MTLASPTRKDAQWRVATGSPSEVMSEPYLIFMGLTMS